MTYDELIVFFTADFDSRLQAGYIAACLLALLICLRPWRAFKRKDKPAAQGDDANVVEAAKQGSQRSLRHHAVQLSDKSRAWMEGPGPGAVLHLLVFVGTATAALIGWRIPAEIERLYGDGAGFGLIFPNVTMPTIGRLAQVIGALTFAVVTLRFLRFLIPLIAILSAIVLTILAVQYVVGTRVLI